MFHNEILNKIQAYFLLFNHLTILEHLKTINKIFGQNVVEMKLYYFSTKLNCESFNSFTVGKKCSGTLVVAKEEFMFYWACLLSVPPAAAPHWAELRDVFTCDEGARLL